MIRIVCVSDTHNQQGQFVVPPGDILIHAGDLTGWGTLPEIAAVNEWLGRLPHKDKIVIAGNHDFLFEREGALARSLITNASYLQDSMVELQGLRFWGSPWQPWFYDWAFNLPRGEALREKWEMIPEGIDVLVTHGPPRSILDLTSGGEHVGCEDLRDTVGRMSAPPQLHVFGHIHEAYGIHRTHRTVFVNASICDLAYRPTNKPVVIDLP